MKGFQKYIYFVSLPPDLTLGYDTYDSFVVIAGSEDEARKTHPNGTMLLDAHIGLDWVPIQEAHRLIVECIGIYTGDWILEPKVLVASYNAG